MGSWDRSVAKGVIESLDLSGTTGEVANYWLSLWDDRPPSRARFRPMRLSRNLPGIAIFEATRDKAVICRVAGLHYRLCLGIELTGLDLMALTPPEQRATRAANIAAILDGAISFAKRPVEDHTGRILLTDELILPFFGTSADGSRFYIAHNNWHPIDGLWVLDDNARARTDLAEAQRILPICRAQARVAS